jgi:glycosyltransferase involved in cell wall biosynthesis
MTAKNTVILTVHDKEATVAKILRGLITTLSTDTDRIIIILDGCTDGSQDEVERFLRRAPPRFRFDLVSTNDVWETKANNVGLKMVESPYATIIQDDMLLKERSWDSKLLDIFEVTKVFAVSGRAAHDFSLVNGRFSPVNLVGREYPLGSVGFVARVAAKVFAWFQPYWIYKFIAPTALRLTVNRGPLVLNMEKVRELNFFDEQFLHRRRIVEQIL